MHTIYTAPKRAKAHPFLSPNKLALAISLAMASAWAEPITQRELSNVAVTGNPLGVSSDAMVLPVSILSGRELSLNREATLGETLNTMPGVAASSFGPNASRPVIRGLDAERVRIMQNGVGILDASSLSFDHAVAVDPLVIEQIDVVRGPAALLYGGSAVGGVVNAIDHRIPTEPVNGIIGRTEARLGGPDNQRNAAAVVDVGNGQFAMHADAYKRKTDDLNIPGFAVSNRKNQADPTENPQINHGKLINSSASSDGGALGASLTFDNGYVGSSYSGFNSNYGTVAEEAVRIDMKSQRLDIASEFRELNTVISRIKMRYAHTDYQHQEIEGGDIGTTFTNKGSQASLELGHAKFGDLEGVLGMQLQNSRFAANGDEAFAPNVHTKSHAVYLYEEMPLKALGLDQLKLSLGGRAEHTALDASAWEVKNKAAQAADFTAYSYALGGLYAIDSHWSVASNLSHNERAPSYFELYADGAHIATNQYEVGNPNFKKERSNGVDAQIRWKDAKNSFSVGAYYTRFNRFLGLLDTGRTRGTDGSINPTADADGFVDGTNGEVSILPEARFTAFAASFKGLEAEGKFNLADYWDLSLRGDYVRASNLDNKAALPRITPLRLGAGLNYQKNALGARLNVTQAFKQNRTAENELPTAGYTDVSAMATYKLPSKLNVELFAKANNLLNQEIREHTSFLKDLSPAGARAVLIGLRADF